MLLLQPCTLMEEEEVTGINTTKDKGHFNQHKEPIY
jgi:hypothetical protein